MQRRSIVRWTADREPIAIMRTGSIVSLPPCPRGLAKFTKWEQMGYGLLLSGAFGNGIDRFVFGHMLDFIDVRIINFAIFNLADVFINLGIVCRLIATFRRSG